MNATPSAVRPANKFYPPPLDPARHLFREPLVAKLISLRQQHRLILIEAQAGQGKSTLAAQYVSRLKFPAGWYQIGPEDGDPVHFLTALLACLTGFLPGFSSPLLTDMIGKGEINAFEYPRYLGILCADLSKQLARECCLVFDDLHLLEELPHSQAFLAHLIEAAPKRLRFVLTSRRPVLLGVELEALRRGALVLGNEALGLSEDEIFTLYNDIFHTPVSRGEARELHRSTEGWIMGLVLAGQEIAGDRNERFSPGAVATLKKAGAGSLADYFHDQVFPRLPAETRQTLCRLSLLATIPLPLAELVSGSPEIAALLGDLAEKNFFVRRLNDAGTEFTFHHLFQEALRIVAAKELTWEERREVLRRAGAWYFEQQQPEEALGYYAGAEDYGALERVLEQEGMALFAMNRLGAIQAALNVVPEEVVREYGWLSLFTGLLRLKSNPPEAFPYLEQARINFETANHSLGKLLILSELIFFHVFMDCAFSQGAKLLQRAEDAFSIAFDDLDTHSKIQVSISLASGNCFLEGNMEKAGYFSSIALQLSQQHGQENLKALANYCQTIISCISGKLNKFAQGIELAYSIVNSLRLNHFTRILLLSLPSQYYGVTGNFERQAHEEACAKNNLGMDMVARSAFEPFSILLEADGLIGIGLLNEALIVIQKGLNLGFAASTPHLRSQYLHYQAYVFSLHGDSERALMAAEESLTMRSMAGGKAFAVMNEMVIGGTYVQLGLFDKAEYLLQQAILHSCAMGEEYLRAGAHAHRASLRLRLGQKDAALADLRECLRCMSENGYPHFFSWTPTVMRPLLETAVANNIYPEYAQKLARDRLGIAILTDGNSIPLLEITTLGGLNLAIEKDSLDSEALTPSMRELLALAISTPGLKVSQEEILAALWPDVNAAKARSRFDSLLLELRKTLKAAFPERDITCWLALKKGLLCLQHCRIDAQRFAGHAEKGLAHARKKEYWQAGNSFRSAAVFWKGTYLPGLRGNDQVSARGEELERLRHDASLTWGRILSETGRLDESIQVLDQALQSDRTSDDLVRVLYNAHQRSNQPMLANQVLKRYEAALKAAEYEPEEIREALEAVWGSRPLIRPSATFSPGEKVC